MAQQTREQIRRVRNLTQAQAAIGWAVVLFIFALVGTIYLRQVGQTATIGREVRGLQEDLGRLKTENSVLERKIAEAQQLDRLQDEARELGFVPADNEDIEYLVVPDYPADVQPAIVVAEPTPPPPPPQSVRAAIWRFIQTQFSNFIRGEAYE